MSRPAAARALLERLDRGDRLAVALLVAVDGSAPLAPGATMLVDAAGEIEGSITGGCVESAAAQEALRILAHGGAPLLATYGISDELAGTAGLTCGGTVHVLVHALAPAAAAALRAFLAADADDRPAAIATLLDGPDAGARLTVSEDGGEPVGSLGAGTGLDRAVTEDLRGLLARGGGAIRDYALDGARLGADWRVHLHARTPAPRIVIVGAIDFSAALAAVARVLGYRVTIADPRASFVASPRYAAAAEVVIAWPAEALKAAALGPRDAVLVFTHDPKLDVPAVAAALETGAGYVGALGSRRTTADRNRRLREAGVADAELARVFAPCGLDIGSATPEETAIAVLAEIAAHRNGRPGGSLRRGADSIRAA